MKSLDTWKKGAHAVWKSIKNEGSNILIVVKKMERKKFLLLYILLLVLMPTYFSLSRVAASPAIGSTTTTIYSVADAHVNSSSPDTNYGGEGYMYVSASSEQDFIYVMFDLSSIPSNANIISAKLSLYLLSTGGEIYWYPADTIGAYYCSDNSWTELGITWNNKPSFNEDPTDTWSFSILYNVKVYKSWNITENVRTALPSRTLTELIKFESKTGDGYAVFHSKEEANKPKLEVEYSTEPVFVVHLESVQDTGATANLGLITFAGYTFSLPTDVDVVNGSYAVTYSGGYTFARWETTGGVTVSDENAVSTTVTVLGNGTLRAVGSAKRLEYTYDHGTPQWHSESAGHMDAVRFTPLFSGQLLTARYYMYDLYFSPSDTFKVHVMDKNRNDLRAPFNVTPTSEGWFDADLSSYGIDVKEGVDFYLGMEWIAEYNPDLGEDRTSPSGRSWCWNGTAWKQETYSDFMIRAVVGTVAPEIVVGVKAGDWVGYGDISFEYASNMPGYEEPSPELDMSWNDMEILDVQDSNVTVRSNVIYKNGTEETYTYWGDVATGEGDPSIGLIPSNLSVGDEIPANLTYYTEEPLKLFINGTVTRSYAGANREVNYVNITYPIIYGNITHGAWNMSFYWDKKTGIMCEEVVSYRMSYTDNETYYYMNMSILWRMTATNMWPAVFTAHDGYTFNVTMMSNSTVSNFNFNESLKQISFNVTGPTGKAGYCNVTVPKDLLRGEPWTILLNSTEWTTLCSITGNDTHIFIHIPYTCSTNTVQIIGMWVIPEFPHVILLLFMVLSIIAVILAKKTYRKSFHA
jgi:hypothetical protein